ncbi:MAG: 2-amino-4-hydroxy-6-hydroxymethyldihydropteridine diphosphokinase [Nitrospirales bacterium]|nr:2-amino-4-hydroxy-6-hydroxymethyldihydropteridine diphosphokinase [Nitrospira sp.]MDR4500575.1 2-amino-4-hydroxy-6-hydroxymethyldihydropteridine diphosphokinase [Nitrospirales bacterium]
METAFIGFGSNVGDRQEFCDRAIALMGLLPQSQLVGVSSYYETQPVDSEGRLGQTWFYNGVVTVETGLSVQRLFEICQETERALGRDQENRNGPRTMDLDILFYGRKIIDEPGLTIPHPRLHLRRFVLEPLVEIDPEWNHPLLNQSTLDLLRAVDDSSDVRRLDLVPGSRYGNRPSCVSPPPRTA